MSKAIFSLLVLVLFYPGLYSQSTPDIQEILDEHAQASGLYSRIQIKSLVSYGVVEQMGSSLTVTIIQKRPSKYRMDVHFEEGRITQSYDGKKGWSLNPFISSDTVGITGMELEQLKESALFDGVLFNYSDLGYEISLLGEEKILTQPSYVIVLKKENGNRVKFFIDQNDYLIKRTEASLFVEGMHYSVSSEFSNFKEVEGMMLPFTIKNMNGSMTTHIKIDHVRVNEPLNDDLFSRH